MEAKDCRNISEIGPLYKGSSLCQLSSYGLGWNGFAVERHGIVPGEHPEADLDRHSIILWDAHVYRGERAERRGGFAPFSKSPSTLSLHPSGIFPAHRGFTKAEAVVCVLDPAFVNGIGEELDRYPTESLHEQIGIHDAGLGQLISLLEAEARAEAPHGRLYADSLAHAIASRLLYSGTARRQPPVPVYRGGLAPARLRRITELVHAKIEGDLSLDELAKSVELSRAHFSHMFRQSTGVSPHQFVLRQKVECAKQMLRRRDARVLDVAVACGFKTQQHFARVFRQVSGFSPTEYQRELLR